MNPVEMSPKPSRQTACGEYDSIPSVTMPIYIDIGLFYVYLMATLAPKALISSVMLDCDWIQGQHGLGLAHG